MYQYKLLSELGSKGTTVYLYSVLRSRTEGGKFVPHQCVFENPDPKRNGTSIFTTERRIADDLVDELSDLYSNEHCYVIKTSITTHAALQIPVCIDIIS